MGQVSDMEKKDYSDEVHLHSSKIVRFLLFIAGSISLILGIIGIFTPILPTTPFLLLSAACYARASHQFYNWLMNNRYFGSYIRDWRIHKTIPIRAKIIAISMIFLTIGTTVFFFYSNFSSKNSSFTDRNSCSDLFDSDSYKTKNLNFRKRS